MLHLKISIWLIRKKLNEKLFVIWGENNFYWLDNSKSGCKSLNTLESFSYNVSNFVNAFIAFMELTYEVIDFWVSEVYYSLVHHEGIERFEIIFFSYSEMVNLIWMEFWMNRTRSSKYVEDNWFLCYSRNFSLWTVLEMIQNQF